MSPIAAKLDTIAAGWVVDLLRLPQQVVPGFCSGDTAANMTGVITARDALLARAGWDVREHGLSGSPNVPVVVSEETHASAMRALRLAGFGREQMTVVPTDNLGRIDIDHFPELPQNPLVLLQAGNVNTGYSDNFQELIPRVHDAGGWAHVDGAFGLWAAASPQLRSQVDGVHLADSWAIDCHKWLNVTYDSGVAICARGEDLHRAMSDGAAYLVGLDQARVPNNLGFQMSQRARGIEVWATILARGRSGIADIVETHCRQAADMAGLLAAGGADILVPPVLNQVLVAFGDATTTDEVISEVQEDRTCWAGSTTWKGRKAMRISVSDTATTDQDIATSANAILRCWKSVTRANT